ncbi:DUF2971 domain-containing protein [Methylophilus sp. UBA6697]|jgi:hypothetical protein|uniref:DUF2971 domain-containing protein n=1 Tax=Methylophilus sp. UBA6697 TaxID=1946902 RepID=UPI000ED9B39D|nr:DUF2971 domain-containing protein [Methylophilus sp. UBA6697]HCU84653.1 DUF2971 domain-containing protein [Methylophilus sp.]
MSKIRLPSRLYKYQAFESRSLENLKAHGIFFNSPLSFNDPYDCATNPFVKRPNQSEVEEIRKRYLADPTIPTNVKNELNRKGISDLQDMLENCGKKVIKETINRFLIERGVTCFSEKNDDLLMWAHYGGSYKGFCLEFSTDFQPFSSAKRVSYHERIPETSITPFLTDTNHDNDTDLDLVADFFCIKPSSWSYEQEWRIIHQQKNTLYHYEANALTGVYFGPEISQEALEIICLILRGQNQSVKFWQGKRSGKEFKVEFKEFNYISHLEAKGLGLL